MQTITKVNTMNTKADRLLNQVRQAQKLGQKILQESTLNQEGVIYAFATADTLIINCKDLKTTWRFDQEQLKLRQAIAQIKSSIQTIWIEKSGKALYHF